MTKSIQDLDAPPTKPKTAEFQSKNETIQAKIKIEKYIFKERFII